MQHEVVWESWPQYFHQNSNCIPLTLIGFILESVTMDERSGNGMLHTYGSCQGDCSIPETWVALIPLEACRLWEGLQMWNGLPQVEWMELSNKINMHLFCVAGILRSPYCSWYAGLLNLCYLLGIWEHLGLIPLVYRFLLQDYWRICCGYIKVYFSLLHLTDLFLWL